MARVLVVDDENLMRTMVEVACRRLGHEALCAATLEEGRRLAAARMAGVSRGHWYELLKKYGF